MLMNLLETFFNQNYSQRNKGKKKMSIYMILLKIFPLVMYYQGFLAIVPRHSSRLHPGQQMEHIEWKGFILCTLVYFKYSSQLPNRSHYQNSSLPHLSKD